MKYSIQYRKHYINIHKHKYKTKWLLFNERVFDNLVKAKEYVERQKKKYSKSVEFRIIENESNK